MTLTTFGSLATLFYLATWALIAFYIKKNHSRDLLKYLFPTTWIIAILLHGVFLYLPLFHGDLRLDITSAGSQVLWLTSLLLLITTYSRKIEVLALFLLPASIALILLEMLTASSGKFVTINGALGSHILLSLLGYSTLFLATLQALLLSIQSKHLRNHKPGGLVRSLPALQDMENLLFRLILMGVVLLSTGLITGFIFLDDLFGKQVLHKTVLSLIAWGIYTTLLVGHWNQGWRGKRAITWTIVAFALLMLAFFGSKFVQEILLSK